MSRNGALWIGGVSTNAYVQDFNHLQYTILQLESYMDESFLQSALEKIGQNNVISIKVMRNKFTGEPASYGFVNFDNDHQALMAMHKLNGKVVPNTNPVNITQFYQFLNLIFIISRSDLSWIIKVRGWIQENRTCPFGWVTWLQKWTIWNCTSFLLADSTLSAQLKVVLSWSDWQASENRMTMHFFCSCPW